MNLIEAMELTGDQRLAIMQLWNEEYPVQICQKELKDFDEYLDGLNGKQHLLLLDERGAIKGWGLLFERMDERWFAIILHHSIQGEGYGTRMLDTLKSKSNRLSGWVTDHNRYKTASGTPYASPLKFYIKNGFSICAEIRLETETLSAVKVIWSVNG